MKKQSTLVLALIICCSAALCQTPAITMTSSKAVGSDIYFTIETTNPQIQVDFGDGILITKILATNPFGWGPGDVDNDLIWYPENTISGKLAISKTVKVYGTGITSFFCFGFKDQSSGRISDSITSLDIGNCTTLKWLDCSKSLLTSLDISKNTALRFLNCSYNKLANLDVSPNTSLEWLGCAANKLTTLNVTQNTVLSTLRCSNNKFTILDVTKNTALSTLACNNNQLNNLDVTKNILLATLECSANQLTYLDVSKNTALGYLYCNANQITSLHFTETTTALGWLECSSNRLTNLDVSKNTKLWRLNCSDNQLTNLNLDKNIFLLILNCSRNPMTSLNLINNYQITTLHCSGIKSSTLSLDVSQNTALTELYCNDNQFISLDVSKNTKLVNFSCSNNKLTSLDLTSNEWVAYMDCSNNQLTSLDVSKNTDLYELYCYDNQLTSLDVSKNPKLLFLFCYNNQFTFATLPTSVIGNACAPQSPIFIDKVLGTGIELDLSSQLTVNGNTTVYTWKTKSGATLVQGTDYSLTDGKTVFLKSQPDSVYCEMTNATFPFFTGEKVLKTTCTKVTVNTDIDNVNAIGVQIYTRNKMLYIVTPCNGQASVYDINGRLAMTKEIATGSNTISLPKGGVYVVRLTGSNTPVVKKVFAGN
jgi:Leucine-rich repeat (LRR) protein